MTKLSAKLARLFVAGAVWAGTIAAQTIIQPTTPIAPTGIGVTETELLFSQPFGTAASQPRGIYSVTNIAGVGPVLSAIATRTIAIPSTSNAENLFAISAGLGGFTAGAVYATNPSTASTDAVFRNGALFINGIPDSNPGHAANTFDSVGTFGNAMIVTTPSGVFGFNSGGALLFAYPTPSGYLVEGATVAPLTNAACPGCLYLAAESVAAETGLPSPPNANLYLIRPATPSGTIPTLVTAFPGVRAESILFVPPQFCTLSGTGFSYFVSAHAAGSQIGSTNSTTGALLAYPQSQVAGQIGRALAVVDSSVYAYDPSSNSFSLFSTPVPIPAATPPSYQLEAAALVGGSCIPETGCPAGHGYWKRHTLPSAMFSGGVAQIGGVPYTASQLAGILNATPAPGNAGIILMQQLIAALANRAAGARISGVVEDGVDVNLAITEAQALLQSGLPQAGFPGANPAGVVFPVNFNAASGNFVETSSTLGGYLTSLATVLADYNNAVGLDCLAGSGLH